MALIFMEGGGNQFDYSLQAHASDMLPLSVLQARLIDLQLPIKVEDGNIVCSKALFSRSCWSERNAGDPRLANLPRKIKRSLDAVHDELRSECGKHDAQQSRNHDVAGAA